MREYVRTEVPREVAGQIRAYVRVQWPGVNRSTVLWDYEEGPNPSVHFVLMDGELVVGHAGVRRRTIAHQGEAWEVMGLSTVFVFPDYRGQGMGERVVRAATERILASGADLGMLFCGERVSSLYRRIGWEHLANARIYYGDAQAPTLKDDNLVMAVFMSDRGQRARAVLEREAVYVGPATW